MSYRLPTAPPEFREPSVPMFDIARHSYISVDNGTISRINIPCFYARRFTRRDRMIWDHMGWPSPDNPDRSDYAQVLAIRDVDLETEGYESVIVSLSSTAPSGLTMSGTLDYNHIVLTISALCNSITSDDVEVPFAIYVSGENEEAGQLRDLVTKGILRIVAGLS